MYYIYYTDKGPVKKRKFCWLNIHFFICGLIFFSYHIWHGFFWYIYKYNYLNGIVANVSRKTEVDQYCNTATVISWFKNLRGKHMRKSIKFDVAEFYPSISENLQIDPPNRLNLLQKLMTMLSTRSSLQEIITF